MNTKMAICFLKRLKFFGKWTFVGGNDEVALVPMCNVDVEALDAAIAALEEKETVETRNDHDCLVSGDK